MATLKIATKPTAFRVLVLPEYIPEEETSEGGIVLVNNAPKKVRQSANQRGVVVAIGKTAFQAFDKKKVRDENGTYTKEIPGEAWCKPGDIVLFTKYGGKFVDDKLATVQHKGLELVLLNDEDITAIIDVDDPLEIEIDDNLIKDFLPKSKEENK